jgi:hypothetical protein
MNTGSQEVTGGLSGRNRVLGQGGGQPGGKLSDRKPCKIT